MGRKSEKMARNISYAYTQEHLVNTKLNIKWVPKVSRKGCGRDSMICNEKLKALVEAYPLTTVRELAAEFGACF